MYFLNPKFQASSHLLWLYSPVCVGPGRKPVHWFSQNEVYLFLFKAKEEQRVKQFVYRVDATSSAVSVGTTHVIQLLNAVLKWQASFEDDKSVLITYG